MDLLQFGLLCIDFLAWPMLALAYPLCASIRAIETGSKYHMRKMVTYWTVLSTVSFFEHTLRVMEWVPLWPYIKLVGTICLVVPRFDGACYAYDCLVNADLGAKLHRISHTFFAHKHLSIDIKAMEQITEQGTEETKSKGFKAMEQTTEQGTEGTKVKSAVENIGEMQKQETEPPCVKGIPVANAAEEKIIPEINSSNLIQREWTCAVCQVTTTSEHNLKSHLGGKRHRINCAELKSIKRVTKDPGSSSLKATVLPNQVKNQPAKHAPAAVAKSKQKTSGEQEKFQVNTSGIKGSTVSVSADPRLYCSICNIWCSREADMASHLKGRKHLSNLQQTGIMMGNEPAKQTPAGGGSKQETIVKPEKATGLPNQPKTEPTNHTPTEAKSKQKTSGEQEKFQTNTSGIKESTVSVSADPRLYCSICNIWCSREADMASHLKGRKHLSNLQQTGIMMGNEPAKQTPAGGGSKQETIVKPEKATGLPNQPKTEPTNHTPTEAKSKQKTSGEQEKFQTNTSGIKESTVSVSADPRLYCSICNIWCSREADMASHLKGRKHLSNLKQMGIMIANEPPAGGGSKQETNVKPEKATGLQYQVKNEAARPNAPAGGGSKQKTNGKQEKAPGQKGRQANGNNASVSTDYKLYCSICNIWAPCEAGMVDHLNGKKHLSMLK